MGRYGIDVVLGEVKGAWGGSGEKCVNSVHQHVRRLLGEGGVGGQCRMEQCMVITALSPSIDFLPSA